MTWHECHHTSDGSAAFTQPVLRALNLAPCTYNDTTLIGLGLSYDNEITPQHGRHPSIADSALGGHRKTTFNAQTQLRRRAASRDQRMRSDREMHPRAFTGQGVRS